MNSQKLKNRPPKNFYTSGSIIIDFFKSIIRNFLKIFNLDVYRTKYYERVERNFWGAFIKEQDNHLMKLYEEGLKRSEGEWSDTFSTKLRFYSMFQMLEQTLKKILNMILLSADVGGSILLGLYQKSFKKSGQDINFHVFDSFEGGLSDLEERIRI